MTEFKCWIQLFIHHKKFIDKNTLVEFNEYIHLHILNSCKQKINRKNYGLVLSMFSWLDSIHPIKIPKFPKKKPKPKPMSTKNLPLINPTMDHGHHHENPTQLLEFSSSSQSSLKLLLCMCYHKKICMQWKWKQEWKVYKYLKHLANKIKTYLLLLVLLNHE
jgi:hypothetical protein